MSWAVAGAVAIVVQLLALLPLFLTVVITITIFCAMAVTAATGLVTLHSSHPPLKVRVRAEVTIAVTTTMALWGARLVCAGILV